MFGRGRERIILSSAQLYWDHDQLHVLANDPSELRVGFFPELEHAVPGLTPQGEDGIFGLYAAHAQSVRTSVRVQKIRDAGTSPPPRMGKEMMGKRVVLAPDDSAFETAASWAIQVPCVEPEAGRMYLRIDYEGDVARFYVDGKLLTDNFYNGTPWVIGLDRVPCRQWGQFELKILPLRNHAPIYLPEGARPAPSADGQIIQLKEVQAIPEYAAIVDGDR
jgi:beta-galactosidase